MLSDNDPRVRAFIKSLTRHGATYRGISTDGTYLKFDIPSSSQLAEEADVMKFMSRLCESITNYSIRVRWMDANGNPVKKSKAEPKREPMKHSPHKKGTVAYEEEINEMIRSVVTANVSDVEFIRVRDRCLESRGMTIQTFSDKLMEGLLDGHSIESQLNRIKESYLAKKRN